MYLPIMNSGLTVSLYCTLQVDQTLLEQLEAVSETALGQSSWVAALDPDVVANLGRYRKYNSSSLRDLLRVIRNKHNHFREMPSALQQKLGPLPEGFLRYAQPSPTIVLTSVACCCPCLLPSMSV